MLALTAVKDAYEDWVRRVLPPHLFRDAPSPLPLPSSSPPSANHRTLLVPLQNRHKRDRAANEMEAFVLQRDGSVDSVQWQNIRQWQMLVSFFFLLF